MSRTVWRIAADTPAYQADDLSGAGAKATGGRWNEVGAPILYDSETRALACRETVVHLNSGGLPLNRYLVAMAVPDDLWAGAQREGPRQRRGRMGRRTSRHGQHRVRDGLGPVGTIRADP